MIYVLASSAFMGDELNEYETIIKIGYCRDDREKKRTEIYITENPTMKKLFTIPGGTEQDEKNLHHHFRKYLKYGNEWFSYNPEILEFFKTHTTKESLWELDPHFSSKRMKEKNQNFPKNKQKYINPILFSLRNNTEEYVKKQEELVDVLRKLPENEVDTYFRTNYPDINFDINIEEITDDVKAILEEFDRQQFFTGKMKYLYSLNMSFDLAKKVLYNITNPDYAKYYWTIPANRAGSLNYQSGKLEEEYQFIVNPKDTSILEGKVKEKILNNFFVNDRYTKADIKEKLKSIYEDLGYNKTPKAVDLEEYFELKKCQITNKDTGKLDNGFKIIKIKEI